MAALASYLDARSNNGSWYLRMEDLDPPREVPGAADEILRTLEALALCWDGQVIFQSRRHDAYAAALDRLNQSGMIYSCTCSRSDLAGSEGRYPGTCRSKGLAAGAGLALRCRSSDEPIEFSDRLQGRFSQSVEAVCGDFIVKRKDGLYAYQLAVVVDDAWQGITHVTRGIDLLDSTPRQIHLQRLLGLASPQYAHIPVLVDADGAKLSKQSLATPINADQPSRSLVEVLRHLQQNPVPELLHEAPPVVLEWAQEHWMPEKLAGIASIREISAFHAPGV